MSSNIFLTIAIVTTGIFAVQFILSPVWYDLPDSVTTSISLMAPSRLICTVYFFSFCLK